MINKHGKYEKYILETLKYSNEKYIIRFLTEYYKGKFNFIDNKYYYFCNIKHRWIESKNFDIIEEWILDEIIPLYLEYYKYLKELIIPNTCDTNDCNLYNDMKDKSLKIVNNLRNKTPYFNKLVKSVIKNLEKVSINFNMDKKLTGFNNCVLDLHKHVFRQGKPDDYISVSTGYSLPVDINDLPIDIDKIKENIVHINGYESLSYDLDNFIEKVLPNQDVRDYTLRFLSSCLSGEVREEKFYFWTGSGSNGKSKLLQLINSTLGGYSKTMDVSYLTTKRGSSYSASPELEAIRYARFVSMSEPERDDQIYVGKLKQITGGTTMTSRGLFKDTSEFKPQFKLMLMCNELPKLAGNDGGVHRRIEVVDFISKFTDNPRPSANNPYQYKADLELGTKLKKWNILFMIKLLDYYKLYDKEGTKAPVSVTEATKVYMTENDVIQKWIANALEEDDNPTPIDDLLDNLKSWCDDEGYDYKKIQKQEVKKVLINAPNKYGPPVFGKVLADNAPNGTSRNPKFNFKSIED